MTGGGVRDATSRTGPTPLDTVFPHLCGGEGVFPFTLTSLLKLNKLIPLAVGAPHSHKSNRTSKIGSVEGVSVGVMDVKVGLAFLIYYNN